MLCVLKLNQEKTLQYDSIKYKKGSGKVVRNLFSPIIPSEKWSNSFKYLLDAKNTDEPTRNMMNEVYSSFVDNDGNFVEQFQSTGFDARTFELYLFAYLSKSGFEFEENFNRPDYIVKRNGIRIAIEATTTNPTAGVKSSSGEISFTKEELEKRISHELPIKFGSSLYSKLQKKYWELEHCKETPFVIAIEGFHDSEALTHSSNALVQYLFGEEQKLVFDKNGNEVIQHKKLYKHIDGDKKIPSGFFEQPNTENVSAVLFSNTGTTAKFKRMGYQNGLYSKFLKIIRNGFEYNYETDATSPKIFTYDLDERTDETWGEGLVICLNPYAKHPLPKDIFPNAAQYYRFEGELVFDVSGFHPFNSKTYTVGNDSKYEPLPEKIRTIFKSELDELLENISIPFDTVEYEWYISLDKSIIGLILLSEFDENWSYVCLEKIADRYQASNIEIDFEDLKDARNELIDIMVSKI